MKLVIVESPNKTHTISQFLGKDYLVLASVGHVRDLATSGKNGFGVDVDNNFTPTYKIIPGKQKIIKQLKDAVSKASEVYLATDPDREGEAIAWHLASVLGLDISSVKRLTFNAITKHEVLLAMSKPSHIDMDLVASQETRRIIDRIIGFDLSELMKSKIKTRSAGRVQSVTLRMIVEHQKEIDSFISKNYYDVKGLFGSNLFEASLYSKDGNIFKPYSIDSKEKLEEIKANLGKEFKVEPLIETQKVTKPKLPFTTSSLQQEAFSRFNYSAKLTSSLAQRLFEGVEINGEFKALITYIRTDSTRLANDFLEVANQYILSKYGPSALASSPLKTKKTSELVQDAHEAIRPIDLNFTPSMAKEYLSNSLYNLYRLIYARTLASLMQPKIDLVTSVRLSSNGYVFKSEASKNIELGFMQAYKDNGFASEKSNTKKLPDEIVELAKTNGTISLEKLNYEEKSTQPPSKYNDGSVVRLMEEKGIGRPSTYASTISTLEQRDYIESEKNILTPTESGKLVVENLVKYFPNLMDYSYTRDMEAKLEQVKEGGTSKVDLLSDFYSSFTKELAFAKENMEKIPDVPTGENCPVCGSPLVYKKSKYGQFIACSNYPKCKYVQKEEKVVEEVPNRTCPNCGSKLVYRTSKKGQKFIGCSNFPKCRYIESLETNSNSEASNQNIQDSQNLENFDTSLENTTCPRCKKGHLVIKKGRYGSFYACSNFPRCRYTQKLETKDSKKDENN